MKNIIIIIILFLTTSSCTFNKSKSRASNIKDSNILLSAWNTGIHPNGFVDYKIASNAEVKSKLEKTYQQLFYSSDGTTTDGGKGLIVSVSPDMAFINSIDSSDIRSEGMSYGMIISVMMNDQLMFNKLWKFSKVYLQHDTGDRKGYFAWSLKNHSPFEANDKNSAPDGEEYFVMALLFAKNRWGNGTGIYNYESEANMILHEMVTKNNSVNTSLVNIDKKQVVFTPDVKAESFTDPSYHLPAFTKLWSKWAWEDKEIFSEMTKASRIFFNEASNPLTGLYPEYATFEGRPKLTSYNPNSINYAHDSHRVIQNIAIDYIWFREDPSQVGLINRILNFAYHEYTTGTNGLVGVYTLEGVPLVNYSSQSQVAMNAVGALAVNNKNSKFFIEKLWDQPTPEGNWRYYNGLLHMLGLLHVSGQFKIYGNPNLVK